MAGDRGAVGQPPVVADHPRGLGERARIEIEHRLGVRLVASLGIVAAQQQQIADAEGGCTHQVALERNAVTVAAGELEDRLDAGLDEQRGRCGRRHVGAGTRTVGHVDGVGDAAQRQCTREEVFRVARRRRHDLGGHHESAGGEAPGERRGGDGRHGAEITLAGIAMACIAIGGALAGGDGRPSPVPRIVQPSKPRAFLDTLAGHRYKVLHGICKQNRRLKRAAGLFGVNAGSCAC